MSAPELQTYHTGCAKKAYASRALALLDIDRMRLIHERNAPIRMPGKNAKRHRRLRRQHPAIPFRAYLCQNCGQWHTTSQEQRG